MLFSSITFLYYFLPVVLIIYFCIGHKQKNLVLLLASLFFYFCGEPIYTWILVFSSVSDYIHSIYIEKNIGTKKASLALASSIIINLGMLFYFKYTNFFIENLNNIFNIDISLLKLTLPIGISFFTFQTMSYTIDVYKGKVSAQKNIFNLATYVCLFPQLVAGPIVRYTDINIALENRTHTLEKVAYGIRRFSIGLAKKILIANVMGEICVIFRDSSQPSVLFYWLYALAFTAQIYFDFSGYSDMAIGLGRIFGFEFPENFDYPYISKSITEFWRRWHMTLGAWFRDYLYIPLGGNRTSKLKWIRNIFIVWFLTGFWHGAAWNFIIWGLMFGVILVLEKMFLSRLLQKTPVIFKHIYVMLIVIISFIIFNANGFTQMLNDIMGLFGMLDIPMLSAESVYYLKSYAVTFLIAIIGATPLPKILIAKALTLKNANKIIIVIEPIFIFMLIVAATAYMVDGSFNPFLYFRF